jgi:hypothetical protein
MNDGPKYTRLSSLSIGDIVEEVVEGDGAKRIGEVIAFIDGKSKKLQLMQLNPHDLTPFLKGNMDRLKFFTLPLENCKLADLKRVRKADSFRPGDIIRHLRNGRLRFGIIVGFTHPEGLYSDSLENGYNGKDLIECVEISGRSGLPHKLDSTGNVKRFQVGSEHIKICEILPMDKNGGVRIKDYWEIKKEAEN